MSAARNGIPPDVVRKAEMQMKRKAPEDLNGRTRTRRKENDGDDGAVPSSTPSMQFNYALEKQLRESSITGLAFTCVMHRERSAMKEALTLLRECIGDDVVKISPMKMPCKAFAFLSFIDEEGEKQVNNSSAIKVLEVMKKVVRVAMRRQNVRFLERMIAISTTCEYNEDAIERAIDRLGIGSQNTFKTFAICHRDSFSKALLSTDKESEKWKSKAVTNAVAAAVAKRIKSVDLQDPDVVIFVVVLAVNDNSTTTFTTSTNTPTRRLGLSFAAKDSNVFTVKKGKGIVATSLKYFCKR